MDFLGRLSILNVGATSVHESTDSGATMTGQQKNEQIVRSLRRLIEIHRSSRSEFEVTVSTLFSLLDLEIPPSLRSDTCTSSFPFGLVADSSTFRVYYRGCECYLGNTLSFGIFKLLAERSNRYVPYSDIISEVWKREECSGVAIRNVVTQLRKKLVAAGMAEIASAIDGSNPEHYGLNLSTTK